MFGAADNDDIEIGINMGILIIAHPA